MRIIDADKLYPDCMSNKGLAITQSQIANAPTIERPHGKWILNNYYTYDCNLCGWGTMVKSYFCPHCGADMRGDDT